MGREAPCATPSHPFRKPREDQAVEERRGRPPVFRPGRMQHFGGRGGAGRSRHMDRTWTQQPGENRKSGNLEASESAEGRNVQQAMLRRA